jgi:hypothetical protein
MNKSGVAVERRGPGHPLQVEPPSQDNQSVPGHHLGIAEGHREQKLYKALQNQTEQCEIKGKYQN